MVLLEIKSSASELLEIHVKYADTHLRTRKSLKINFINIVSYIINFSHQDKENRLVEDMREDVSQPQSKILET